MYERRILGLYIGSRSRSLPLPLGSSVKLARGGIGICGIDRCGYGSPVSGSQLAIRPVVKNSGKVDWRISIVRPVRNSHSWSDNSYCSFSESGFGLGGRKDKCECESGGLDCRNPRPREGAEDEAELLKLTCGRVREECRENDRVLDALRFGIRLSIIYTQMVLE